MHYGSDDLALAPAATRNFEVSLDDIAAPSPSLARQTRSFEASFNAIDAPSPPLTLDERATRQLGATAIHDDASRTALTADQVGWSVQSGPLAGIDLAPGKFP